jgi:PIN domain nuclease of toxin-antitoxin system
VAADAPTQILLDTCAVIWISEDEQIAPEATVALNRAEAFVSPMTAWEVGLLIARGRLTSPMSPQAWFRRVVDQPRVTLSELTTDMLIASSFLPGEPPSDPVDRILIATAREHGLVLMTRDRALLDYAEQGHLEAIAC